MNHMSNDMVAASYHERGFRFRKGRIALLEGAAIFLALFAISKFNLLGMASLPVDPYLLAIALLGTQYGIYGGLLSALAAIGMRFIDGLPARPIDVGYFEFGLEVWSLPLVWLFAGLLIGLVSEFRHVSLARRTAELDAANAASLIIAEEFEALSRRTRQLERQLAGFSSAQAESGEREGQPERSAEAVKPESEPPTRKVKVRRRRTAGAPPVRNMGKNIRGLIQTEPLGDGAD
jgi:hypothetical protein